MSASPYEIQNPMTPNFIDPWQWYRQSYFDALARGDQKRQQLRDIFDIFAERFPNDSDYLLKLLQNGLSIARQLNEPYWELLFLYWRYRLETGGRTPLDETTRIFVHASNRAYRDCPILGFIYADMVEAYVLHDPLSYAHDVLDAIAFTIENLGISQITYCNLLLSKARLLYELQDFHAVDKPVKTLLKYGNDNDNFMTMAFLYSACAAYHQRQYDYARINIDAAYDYAQQQGDGKNLITVLMWQATILAATGEHIQASKVRQEALTQQLITPNIGLYYISFEADAEYWRHTLGWWGQYRMLEVLNNLLDKTPEMPFCEFDTRMSIIRAESDVSQVVWWLFRAFTGMPSLSRQIAIAESIAQQMPRPEMYLARLEGLRV